MALTKKQKELRVEAEKMATLAQIDFWNVEDVDGEARTWRLALAVNNLAVAAVVGRYTLIDEVLANCICRYYFKTDVNKPFIRWHANKFRIFVNYLLDETYLLKKMETVHAIKPLPSEVRSMIYKVNNLRNALAHSFFPEKRKEHRKIGKVLYDGKDIRTAAGLESFITDCNEAFEYLAGRAYGRSDRTKKVRDRERKKPVKTD